MRQTVFQLGLQAVVHALAFIAYVRNGAEERERLDGCRGRARRQQDQGVVEVERRRQAVRYVADISNRAREVIAKGLPHREVVANGVCRLHVGVRDANGSEPSFALRESR